VVEIVNNWTCRRFEDTYRPPLIGARLAHVLDTVQPDVLHVHSLLNLSFDLPAAARSRGIPIVATLHDYSLLCPSGGQRIHRRDQHVCHTIDTARCARCFRESPFYAQTTFGRVTALAGAPGGLRRSAAALVQRVPGVAGRLAHATGRAVGIPITQADLDDRLAAARHVFDAVDLFVAPSPFIGAEFVRLGIPPSKIRVSDYGMAPIPLVRAPEMSAHRPVRLGFVGTLVWHKGVHVLLDAVRALPPDTFELSIFGDPNVFPDYTADLRRRAAGLPIRFKGPFDRARTAHVYSQIDLLVVPSLWLENSPLVIHEAFMAGIPVVGARIGGIADLVDDGRTGVLYEAASTTALASALRGLIGHPERLRELTAAVQAMPPLKPMADEAREWEAVYAGLLDARAWHSEAGVTV
jgi:glycosyltransferase involved in cell wall biosynthesis